MQSYSLHVNKKMLVSYHFIFYLCLNDRVIIFIHGYTCKMNAMVKRYQIV